jgi:hypothetical protein
MNIRTMNLWRSSQAVGQVRVVGERDLNRVGNCWMQGRLRVGDVIAVLALSGDCFWTYQLLEGGDHVSIPNGYCPKTGRLQMISGAYRIAKGATFGAYEIGTLLDAQPTPREWLDLLEGERSVHFTGKPAP